jgi:hypothetical protein
MMSWKGLGQHQCQQRNETPAVPKVLLYSLIPMNGTKMYGKPISMPRESDPTIAQRYLQNDQTEGNPVGLPKEWSHPPSKS